MIRYEYVDKDDEGCPVFRGHSRCSVAEFLDEKWSELDDEGWKVLRYAYCENADVPDHLLHWRQGDA